MDRDVTRPCRGAGDYEDLGVGAPLAVLDGAGNVIATSVITDSLYQGGGDKATGCRACCILVM